MSVILYYRANNFRDTSEKYTIEVYTTLFNINTTISMKIKTSNLVKYKVQLYFKLLFFSVIIYH